MLETAGQSELTAEWSRSVFSLFLTDVDRFDEPQCASSAWMFMQITVKFKLYLTDGHRWVMCTSTPKIRSRISI